MTEKEKAVSMVDEFYQHTNTNSRESAKACAKIMAKEVLVKLRYYGAPQHAVEFWEEVVLEIDHIESWSNVERPPYP